MDFLGEEYVPLSKVMTEEKAGELGYRPLGALSGYAYAGCDPKRMGLGPVYAIAKAEEIEDDTGKQ